MHICILFRTIRLNTNNVFVFTSEKYLSIKTVNENYLLRYVLYYIIVKHILFAKMIIKLILLISTLNFSFKNIYNKYVINM